MCGRYLVADDLDDIYGDSLLDLIAARGGAGEIFPGSLAPVFAEPQSGEKTRAELMKWGVFGFSGRLLINARAETVFKLPSFARSAQCRRCLLPASGYYEWRAGESGKTKMLFSRADGEPMLLGGIWEPYTDAKTGKCENRFTVITRAAQGGMLGIHERMPLLVAAGSAEPWLADLQAAAQMLSLPQGDVCGSAV